MHVTAQNEAILHNKHHRRDEGESYAHHHGQPILSDDYLYEVSSETDGTSTSGECDEALNIQKAIVSSKVCKLTDQRHVSLRSTADILNDAAESLASSGSKRSYITLYRTKKEMRFDAAEKAEEKMKIPFQLAIEGKKVLGKERFAILVVTQEGEYFLGQKTFSEDESCNASSCTNFILG